MTTVKPTGCQMRPRNSIVLAVRPSMLITDAESSRISISSVPSSSSSRIHTTDVSRTRTKHPQYHWHHEQPPTGIYLSVFSLLGKPTDNFQNTGPHSCLFTQRSKLRFSRGASTLYRDQSAVISESQQAARLSG